MSGNCGICFFLMRGCYFSLQKAKLFSAEGQLGLMRGCILSWGPGRGDGVGSVSYVFLFSVSLIILWWGVKI